MKRGKNSAFTAAWAASVSAGCACPSEMTLSFRADVLRSVGPFETTMYIEAESGSRHADLRQLCRSVTRDIAAYRWDLDGDGVYETRADSLTRTIRFEEVGTYVVGVEVRDERGERRTKALVFEVLSDDPDDVLAQLEFGAGVRTDFSCQVSVCAGVRLDYEGVTLDEVVLRDGAGQVLAARQAIVLKNDVYQEVCVVPAAGVDVSGAVAEVRWHGASLQVPVEPLSAQESSIPFGCDPGRLPTAP